MNLRMQHYGAKLVSYQFYNLASGPKLALDGLIYTWTHTKKETNPWWRVDLLKVYRVIRVTITNRPSHALRINGAVIRIVFVDRNLAVDGAATQSSTFPGWFAEKAIDSNRGFQQLNTRCSSTLTETNPWWRLDLRKVYRISEVVVTNREYGCTELINRAEIRIGNSLENNGNKNPICAVIPAIPAGESYRYLCNGIDGRYVNLIIPGDMKTLALCEVEVYGEGVTMSHIFVNKTVRSTNTF
ncbi:fucolectin-1-like [Sinocyclocheilus rhinocerous]|uniref:fucolectin-1-like n=1 Tax=Sinocyclocheilus rhinocerous TaxID=307959 RepID=UPI0007B8EA71|nr:PREDICTED: fucolectin-1-like [Sinocyclocheilus rhinocerous]